MSKRFDEYLRELKGISRRVGEGGIIVISGGGDVKGGRYKEIHISGGATITGDVETEVLTVAGGLTAKGGVKAGLVDISGGASFTSLECDNLNVSGGINVRGSLRVSRTASISGGIVVDGDLSAGDSIKVTGGLSIGGKLLSDVVEIRLGGRSSRIGEGIEARDVKILSAKGVCRGLLYRIYSFVGRKPCVLNTGYIKADNIVIENVVCRYIEGNTVNIGPGCRIVGEVVYREHLELSSKSEVASTRKLG